MTTKAYEERLKKVSDTSFDSVDLFHTSHDRWPLTSASISSNRSIHISVFDSSFNPPTKAHLTISLTTFPGKWHDPAEYTVEPVSDDNEAYTTRLLLLSARNVDKSLKPGDATLAQRIEMMHLQSLDMQDRLAEESVTGVAVAALNHPTFVGKSSIILRWLREQRLPQLGIQPDSVSRIKLTFLIGSDTLTRLFMPKYYLATPSTPSTAHTLHQPPTPEENMQAELDHLFVHNNSFIVSTPRFSAPESRSEELAFIRSTDECRRRLHDGQIRFVKSSDWGGDEMDMSSTAVRKAVEAGDEGKLDRLCGGRVKDYIVREQLYKGQAA